MKSFEGIPIMDRSSIYIILITVFTSSAIVNATDEWGSEKSIRQAVRQGLAVIQKAARNYPENRSCFSCHHQTLPMQAMVVARQQGFQPDEKLLQSQAKFTLSSFDKRLKSSERRASTDPIHLSFGLWALDLAQHPADETTEAMIKLLLKKQQPDGSFGRGSNRPPLQQSVVTSTVLTVHYMRRYVGKKQNAAVEKAAARAKKWLESVKPKTQEDLNSRIGGLALLRSDPKLIAKEMKAILKAQRKDGGWAQKEDMESDAYATGQTLFTLQRVRLPVTHPAYQRGVKFLLKTQLKDGSWFVKTRSKPLQTFFDNGDPHGKHQFISIPATSWGTAALALALPKRKLHRF